MLQCGSDYYENLTLEKVDKLINELRTDGRRRTYPKADRVEI
jgi:hypothetical protein